jgi:hypothetical protein
MELNAETHNGVGLHRILGKGNGDQGAQRMFGGMPAFYVGAGRGAVWFGLGKDGTVDQLKQAMTLVETIPAVPITPEKIAPFQLVLNLSSWVAMSSDEEIEFPEGPADEDPERAARRAARQARAQQERKDRIAAAKEAFKPDNDRLLITSRPVQDGFRMRLQFDEGFIKFLGLTISQQLDRSQL